MDSDIQRAPVKRGRPPKPKLKVEKILIKEEDYQYDSDDNDSKYEQNMRAAALERSGIDRAESVKSNSNSSRSLTLLPSLAQLEPLSDEGSEDEEIMSVLGTKGTSSSSKPRPASISRRGSVASRTRMTAVGKRRSTRLKKPASEKKESSADDVKVKGAQSLGQSQLSQPPRRGRPLKCVLSIEKLQLPRLPSVVGQGKEINVDSESEASSDAGSYTHYYNKRRLNSLNDRSSPIASKISGGEEGDSEDNGSYVEIKTERDESDIDSISDVDECLGGKRVRAAAAVAMELVTKKRLEAISDRDRERAERRNRKPYIKPFVPKGRSRRTIVFKRGSQKPTKGVDSIPFLTFMKSIVYKGVYFQEGDIVYILGQNERPFYCQIRHIARDWNNDAICGLFWLTPKKTANGAFSPENYDIRDDFPEHTRKFEFVTFVMHCPLDYWYGHELSYFHPLPGTVYQRLGEPLVEYVKLPPKSLKSPETKTEEIEKIKTEDELKAEEIENSEIKEETESNHEIDIDPEPECVPDVEFLEDCGSVGEDNIEPVVNLEESENEEPDVRPSEADAELIEDLEVEQPEPIVSQNDGPTETDEDEWKTWQVDD